MATEVCAEMVANVVSLVVGVGDAVAAGDTLLILESMKMEIPVVAPRAGRLIEICVTVGEMLAEGTVVARLE